MKLNPSLKRTLFQVSVIYLLPVYVFAQGICNPDKTPPVLENCPYDMSFKIPDRGCDAVVDWALPIVISDDCDSVNAISSVDFFTFLTGHGDGTNGQFIIYPGADSFTVVGTTNGTPGNGNNRFSVCFYSSCNGMLGFTYTAKMNNGDGFINDRARLTLIHAVHGADVDLPLTPGNDSIATGILQATQILAGDRFCIEVQSDNTDGVDSITIRDLIFVPDPIQVVQTLGPAAGDTLPQGTYAVEYTATDCGGNTSYCDFLVHVLPPDTVDLVLACPDDITIQLPSSSICDTIINWDLPTVATCGTVNGFREEMNPFILGTQLTEAAALFMGDSIIGTDGLVYVNPARDSLILIGTNNGTPGTQRHDTSIITVCVKPRCSGRISFDWSASVGRFMDFNRDEAGIIFNGKDSILSEPLNAEYAFGTVSFDADTIHPLCFYVRSTNMMSEDTFIIRNFSFTPVAPQIIELDTNDINKPLKPGNYTFNFLIKDCYGNQDSCSFDATIVGNKKGSIACKDINVSLDQNCHATITPDMIVTGYCTASMVVNLSYYGQSVPNPVDSHYLGKHVIATALDTITGNSCWSNLMIEDKLAPLIICHADTTDCYSFNFDFPLNYVGSDCSRYTVSTINERIEHFYCDETFLKAVYRDILITDANGITDQCTDTIFVKRIKAGDIFIPEKTFTLSCEKPFLTDENGHPSPLEIGLPSFPTVGGYHVLWPLNLLLDCNLLLQYEDIDLGEINCTRKIMRSWTIREWWCGTEITRNVLQIIVIKDETGPAIIHAPFGFDATTSNNDCFARVLLPSIDATDACHNPVRIDIAYPGGILTNQNGGYANLPGGDDTIYYRLYDGCLNLTEYSIIIHVHDNTPPVAVCDRNTVVALNHSGFDWVPAEVFDDGSFDECALDHFEVRRMDSDFCGSRGADDWSTEVGFCCEDVGKMVMVALKAVDRSGNEAICMVNVEVQDKDKPIITCLPNITVDCRFDIDYNHLEVFGKIVTDTIDREPIVIDPRYYHVIDGIPVDGIAQDNCPPTILEKDDFSNINQCGIGYIVRFFQAQDRQGNLSDECAQVITIINHDIFDENDIVWPQDLDTLGICNPNELIPERLKVPFDKPTFHDDECSLKGISYSDVLFSATLPGDPCFKIIRTWKVIDWCQHDKYGNIIVWSHDQIIKVRNIVDPIITKVSTDTVICSYEIECKPIPVTFSIEASDDCTSADQMLYTYRIDFNGDGSIDVVHAAIGGNTASGTWPIGRHLVHWEVEDRCGNTATAEFVLDLRNCKSPVAYCLNGLSTNLTPRDLNGDGIADVALDTIWAKDFDHGSYHSCGYPISLSFSNDLRDTYRVFNCDSLGLREVELWVTDINGNTSFCRTFIDVQDNQGFCPNSVKNSNVEGLIETEKKNRVENVDITLMNSGMNQVKTDANGKYLFAQIPNGSNVTVMPTKTDGWLNGVTTSDIVKIQRHILGIEPFNSPYQMIAADVNKSHTITAKDVSDLRKLILGIYSDIPGNTSWRFVNQLYSFNDVTTTLDQNFPESYEINPLHGDMNLNFYAVKTGDVNSTAATKGLNGNINRNRNVLELQTDEQQFSKDESREVEVRVVNGSEFSGMQFTLQWDINQMELQGIHGNEELKIHDDNYSLQKTATGKLTFSWNGEIKNGNWILKLWFKAHSAGKLSEVLNINSSITPAVSVLKDITEDASIAMSFKGVSPDEFILLQNEPNPWNQITKIGMILPQAGEVNITIYDVTGKIFIREKVQMSKGRNEYLLNEKQFPHSGIYYYQIDYQTNTETRKMLIIK